MLPDFPALKEDLHHVITLHLRGCSRGASPILQLIPHTQQHEGGSRALVRSGGEESSFEYKLLKQEISVPNAEAAHMNLRQLLGLVENLAVKMTEEIMTMVYTKIGEASEQAGTSIDFAGRKYDCEAHVEALSKIYIEFDGHPERPIMPVMAVTPELGARLKELLPQWEQDPKCKALMAQLIGAKYEEWRARQNRKQLVD